MRGGFDDLHILPCPFIAHTTTKGGEFLLVENIDNKNVLVSNERWSDHKLSHEEFKKKFSGIVLTAEASSASAPELFNKNKVQARLESLRTPFVIIGSVLISLLVLFTHLSHPFLWQMPALIIIVTMGLIASILLLVQSIDNNNPLIERLCQSGSKTNCNAILTSNAAKVFDWLSWSEVGFFYFAGSWLMLLCNPGSVAILQLAAMINIIGIPYTVYSIYYQWRVAKQWCILCCAIQGLLWLELIPSISVITQTYILPNSSEFIAAFACFVVPVLVWVFLKPFLLKAQQTKHLKAQLRKFKYDSELFEKLLKQGPNYAPPHEGWSIVLGNVEASTIITMVSNPYCQPCAAAHKVLDGWLGSLLDIQVRIIFNADNSDKDFKTPVVRHLMALSELQDKKIVKEALHDWYEQKQKDYGAWAKTYPVTLDADKYQKLEKQLAWCYIADVTFTPTILINGYRLPANYRLQDIKYLLTQH